MAEQRVSGWMMRMEYGGTALAVPDHRSSSSILLPAVPCSRVTQNPGRVDEG